MSTRLSDGPAYVPSGFKLARRVTGAAFDGFAGAARQESFLYQRGTDYSSPLAVYVASGAKGQQLFATENHEGTQIAVNRTGAESVYHDGIWASGPGLDQVDTGDVVIHWENSNVHSITSYVGEFALAARGSRSTGVSVAELVRVVESITLA